MAYSQELSSVKRMPRWDGDTSTISGLCDEVARAKMDGKLDVSSFQTYSSNAITEINGTYPVVCTDNYDTTYDISMDTLPLVPGYGIDFVEQQDEHGYTSSVAIECTGGGGGGGSIYNGISPIVVNNNTNQISAKGVSFGVQSPLFFVKDDNEAVVIGCSAGGGGGGTTYTGDAQGALDEVYANSGIWLTGDFSGAGQPILFTDKNSVILSSKNTSIKNGSFNYNWSGDYGTSIDFSLSRNGVTSNYIYQDRPWEKWGLNYISVYGNSWELKAEGVTGSQFIGGVSKPWSALRNVDLGLTTGGTVSSISGHNLSVGSVNNIVLTSTLPATPDANTLYLIPEA